MGLLGRIKGLTAPPAPPLPDGDEVPPWLREAAPQAFGPASQAHAAPSNPAPPPPPYTPPSSAPKPVPAPTAYSPPPPSPTPAPAAQPNVAQIVNRLTDVVLENWRSYPLDAETLSLLQIGLPYLTQRDCSRDAILAGQTAARLGYVARAAEYAEFPRARETDDDLGDELADSLEAADRAGGSVANAMAEFAADLALSEPVDPPASAGGPSWVVPGVGGAVRGRLRDALLKGVRCPADITAQDLQHTWKYGYFLRSMEEFFFDEA